MIADTDGELTAAERVAIFQQIKEVEISEKMSVADIAYNMGCSPTLLSQARNNKYPRNIDKYLIRARKWLAERSMVADRKANELADTTISKAIRRTCVRAWQRGAMARIVLPSGAGKTAALLDFKRKSGRRVLYVLAHQAGSTITGLLRAIARAAGVTYQKHDTASEMFLAVRDAFVAMRASDSKMAPLILIDEATALKGRCLNYIRQFHDDPDIRAAIVLADTKKLDRELDPIKDMAGGYEQLHRRLSYYYPPRLVSQESLVTLEDVKAVVATMLTALGHGDARLTPDAWTYLHRLAQGDGMYGTVAKRLEAVAEIAEDLGVQPRFTCFELDYAVYGMGGIPEYKYPKPPFGADAPAGELRKVG